jgi:hypothetical protein
MRKLTLLIVAIVSVTVLSGSTTIEVKPTLNANNIMLPVGKTDKKISLMELSQISISEFQTLTGKKLKFFDRLNFKIAQKKLRNSINEDGTFRSKKVEKFFNKAARGDGEGFHIGGFALGFLLGLLGVLIAYLINDDIKSNRVKWAWIGCGVLVVLLLLASAL